MSLWTACDGPDYVSRDLNRNGAFERSNTDPNAPLSRIIDQRAFQSCKQSVLDAYTLTGFEKRPRTKR